MRKEKNINTNNRFISRLFDYFIFIFIVLLFSIIYSLLIYYNKVNSNEQSVNTLTFIIGITSFLLLGIIVGIRAKKNGLIEGLFAGLIIIIIVLLSNLIWEIPFVSKTLIKIITYLTASSVGGIIGVNIRK